MRRLVLAVAVAVAILSSGAGAAPAGTTTGPSLTPPDATLVAAGPDAALTLLYTGDVIGYIDPCG